MHVLLVRQRIHHEELCTDLLQLLVLFVVFELHMQEAFKILIKTLILFDRHLYLVEILRGISTKLEIEVQL